MSSVMPHMTQVVMKHFVIINRSNGVVQSALICKESGANVCVMKHIINEKAKM